MESFSTDNPLEGHLDPSAAEFTWMRDAKCRGIDPAEFFPSDGLGVDRARRVCDDCPVKAECLEYALEYRIEHGVWGGASERERRRILRRRRGITLARS
jgi:WhiB family redox-sensing transcriptional regulator